MSTEPYAVLAVDLDPQHFPDGDDICLTAGSYLARELGASLKQHGHDIPDWIQGGCEEDFGVVLESHRGDVCYNYTIVFFPESGRDYRMAIQYGIHVGVLRRMFRGVPKLAADDPLHDLLRAFGGQFQNSELLTSSQFEARC